MTLKVLNYKWCVCALSIHWWTLTSYIYFWITFPRFNSYIYLIPIFIFNILNKTSSPHLVLQPHIQEPLNRIIWSSCSVFFTKHLSTHTSYIVLSSLPHYKPSEHRPNIDLLSLIFPFPRISLQNILFFFCNRLYFLFLYPFPNFLFLFIIFSDRSNSKSHNLHILEQ